MPYINFNERPKVKIWEGIEGAIFHSGQATFGHITLQKGIVLPEHHHPHEQWTHVIEGELLFELDGEQKLLTAGMTAYIPSNSPHSAKAVTLVKVIDCFMPARDDWKELEIQQHGSH